MTCYGWTYANTLVQFGFHGEKRVNGGAMLFEYIVSNLQTKEQRGCVRMLVTPPGHVPRGYIAWISTPSAVWGVSRAFKSAPRIFLCSVADPRSSECGTTLLQLYSSPERRRMPSNRSIFVTTMCCPPLDFETWAYDMTQTITSTRDARPRVGDAFVIIAATSCPSSAISRYASGLHAHQCHLVDVIHPSGCLACGWQNIGDEALGDGTRKLLPR